MSLPIIKHPIYKLTIPSTEKVISYRPYTVQEEKLLLIVRLSEDIEEVIMTLKQIIRNCVLDEINVDKLAMFDIEYIFVNIRKVSVSNIVELFYTEEDEKIPFMVDLEQVKIKFTPSHSNRININTNVGIKMNYPNLSDILKLEFIANQTDVLATEIDDQLFEMFVNSIDSIYDNEKTYTDFTKEELRTFVLSLPVDSMSKIREFFDTMPVLEHNVKVKLPSGEIKEVKLKGLKDFFTF